MQFDFLMDFARRINIPYYVEPLQEDRRASSFAELQQAFSCCPLSEEEIRQECEIVREELYKKNYAL